MPRSSTLFLLAALAFTGCDGALTEAPEAATAPDAFARAVTVEPAPEWTALFDRESGWTGADGIYSIPLGGNDAIGTAGQQQTAFVFSDTFIGEVLPDGSRAPGGRFVNNSLALLDGAEPDPDAISFYWRGSEVNPKSVFVPQTLSAGPDDWYWLQDGFVNQALGGATHLFAARIRSTGTGGVFGFETAGIAVITLPAGARPPFESQQQVELPFFQPAQGDRGEIIFGPGIFVNTAAAGAPDPDGFVYVYGTESVPFNKYLVAARVRPEDFLDFDQWRFYNGAEWTADASAVARLADPVSNELSVTPLPAGGYGLVYKSTFLSATVDARTAPTPVGPYGPVRELYRPPEQDLDPDLFTYNAKAHPHLSAPGTLLISYNVNTLDFFGDFFRYADIYRPRFVRVRF